LNNFKLRPIALHTPATEVNHSNFDSLWNILNNS